MEEPLDILPHFLEVRAEGSVLSSSSPLPSQISLSLSPTFTIRLKTRKDRALARKIHRTISQVFSKVSRPLTEKQEEEYLSLFLGMLENDDSEWTSSNDGLSVCHPPNNKEHNVQPFKQPQGLLPSPLLAHYSP